MEERNSIRKRETDGTKVRSGRSISVGTGDWTE